MPKNKMSVNQIARPILLCTFLLVSRASLAGEPKWTEVRSEHFVVVSDGSEKQAREVAMGFEKIRAVFAQGLFNMRVDSGAETIILAPSDENAMKALLPALFEKKRGGGLIAGLFHRGWEKDYVIVRLDMQGEGSSTIYHEYVHKLVALNFPRLPMWLDEGLAEFFGNAQFRENKTLLGVPSPRIRTLRERAPIPFPTFLAVTPGSPYTRDDDKVLLFYAQAWGFTHFLMFGPGMGNGEKLNEYLRLLQTGINREDAFKRAFGDPASLEYPFDRYFRQFELRAMSFKDPIQIEKASLIGKKLTPAEAYTALAGLHVYFRDNDKAHEEVQRAITADPKLAGAHEFAGLLAFQTGNDSEATKEFTQAVSLDPKLYLARFYMAMMGPSFKGDTNRAKELEQQLAEVQRLAPNFAPAYVIRSRVFVAEQKFPEALESAMKARNLEPDRAGYHLNLAQIRFLSGDAGSALQISKYVARRWTGTDRFEGLALLAAIREQAKIPPSSDESDEEATLAAETASLTRAEGVVESVLCEKSKPFELTLRQGEKRMKFQSGRSLKGMGFADTIWYGHDRFDPCRHTAGLNAIAWYSPQAATEPIGLEFLEFHDDALSTPQAPAPAH
jgi:tetratricopeptide (TPR) repeat protein